MKGHQWSPDHTKTELNLYTFYIKKKQFYTLFLVLLLLLLLKFSKSSPVHPCEFYNSVEKANWTMCIKYINKNYFKHNLDSYKVRLVNNRIIMEKKVFG